MLCSSQTRKTQKNIVLMGDAAHATSPSIGMGMNTALRDAQAFYNILKKTKDNLAIALPKYSEERVKEGNSLTSLTFNLYCLDQKQQAYEIIHQIVRTILYKFFPSFVKEHPQTMIGRRGIELSDVFSQSMQLGIMQKYRAPPVFQIKTYVKDYDISTFRLARLWGHLLVLYPYPLKIRLQLGNLGEIANYFQDETRPP